MFTGKTGTPLRQRQNMPIYMHFPSNDRKVGDSVRGLLHGNTPGFSRWNIVLLQDIAEIKIIRVLKTADISFGVEIGFFGAVMVEVFLKQVEQYRNMRGN